MAEKKKTRPMCKRCNERRAAYAGLCADCVVEIQKERK